MTVTHVEPMVDVLIQTVQAINVNVMNISLELIAQVYTISCTKLSKEMNRLSCQNVNVAIAMIMENVL